MFEDEESQAFYEALPELQALVPAMLLQDAAEAPADAPQAAEAVQESGRPSVPQTVTLKADRAEKEAPSHGGEDALFAQLPACTSVEACDSFCANFCLLGRKAARKRLVRACHAPAMTPAVCCYHHVSCPQA